jgi:hypothetical protein
MLHLQTQPCPSFMYNLEQYRGSSQTEPAAQSTEAPPNDAWWGIKIEKETTHSATMHHEQPIKP